MGDQQQSMICYICKSVLQWPMTCACGISHLALCVPVPNIRNSNKDNNINEQKVWNWLENEKNKFSPSFSTDSESSGSFAFEHFSTNAQKYRESKKNNLEIYKKAKISAPMPTSAYSPCESEETSMIIDNDTGTIGQNIENYQNSDNVRNNGVENNTAVTLGQIRRYVYLNDNVAPRGATIEHTNNDNARTPFFLKRNINIDTEFNRQNNKVDTIYYAGKSQNRGSRVSKSMNIENISDEGSDPDDNVITIRAGSTMLKVVTNKKKHRSVKKSLDKGVQTSNVTNGVKSKHIKGQNKKITY